MPIANDALLPTIAYIISMSKGVIPAHQGRAATLCRSALAGALLLFTAACATTSGNQDSVIDNDQSLQRVALPGGDVAFGWVAPTLADQGYRTALVEPVVFLPEGREAGLIHPSDLSLLGRELDNRLRRAALARVAMRDTPASDALRFRMSITGLRVPLREEDYTGLTQGESLFPELATGQEPERSVFIVTAMEASDSITGVVLARSLRRSPAIELSEEQRHVSMYQLDPLLDDWVAQWAASITQLVLGRDTDSRSLFTRAR